jgi:hypothetical protein
LLRRVLLSATFLATACGPLGCECNDPEPTTPSPSATTTTSASTAPSASAAAPKPYEGPTGRVVGTVIVEGDEPPKVEHTYPTGCESAVATYGKLFRTGQDGGLADVVVTVTHYDGFVPPKSDKVPVTIKDCTFDRRVYTLTAGQHLDVRNVDVMRSYVPHMEGARAPADLVAVPRGPAIQLHSRGLGRYFLGDQMGRNFMKADVFHLRFSTTAVTGLDGKFAIDGIPVGKAKVGILWPAANMKTETQDLEIKPGDNTVDFRLSFDAKKDVPPPEPEKGQAAPGSSGSAKPPPAPAPAPSGGAKTL